MCSDEGLVWVLWSCLYSIWKFRPQHIWLYGKLRIFQGNELLFWSLNLTKLWFSFLVTVCIFFPKTADFIIVFCFSYHIVFVRAISGLFMTLISYTSNNYSHDISSRLVLAPCICLIRFYRDELLTPKSDFNTSPFSV